MLRISSMPVPAHHDLKQRPTAREDEGQAKEAGLWFCDAVKLTNQLLIKEPLVWDLRDAFSLSSSTIAPVGFRHNI